MNTQCAICLEHLESADALKTTPCGHVFHQQCLMAWLSRLQTCPQCRFHVSVTSIRSIYLNFSSDNLATTRNLENKIVILQQRLAIKEQEISTSRLSNKTLRAELESVNRHVDQLLIRINGLDKEEHLLSSKLKVKTAVAERLLEWLHEREKEIRRLEDNARIDYELSRMRIRLEREQQDKLIEKLTDSRREFATLKRKFELASEQRVNEITISQKSKAVKAGPVPFTENAADRSKDNYVPKRTRL